MLARSFLFLAVLGLATTAEPARSAAADAATPPTLIVRFSSIDGVIADVKYLVGLAGREAEAKRIDDLVKKTFPKGFAGIDTKRPLGGYGILDPEGNLQDISGALLVPITDEKAFLGLLESFVPKLKLQKGEDGTYASPSEEGKVPIYLRFAHGYAYLTIKDKSVIAPSKLLQPSRVLAVGPGEAASASLRIDQIPTTIKQAVLSIIETRLLEVEESKTTGESAAQHAFKVQVAKEAARKVSALLQEGSEVAVHLDLNRQANTLALEASLAGKPGTRLADGIFALGQSQSLFAGLLSKDSAMSGLIHLLLPEGLSQVWGPLVDDAIRKELEKEKDATKRAKAEKVFRALAPSLKAGVLDAAVDLRRSGSNKHYTLVAGLEIKDGAAIDQAIRSVIKELAEAERARIKMDAETFGNVPIHRIEVKWDLDPEAHEKLGDNPFYFAVRSNAVFVSGGQEGLKALKVALAAKPGPTPLLHFQLSLARLAPGMASTKTKFMVTKMTTAAQKAFGEPDKGNDKIQVSVEGGKVLKLRLDLSAPVIKFLSLIDQ